MAFSISVTPKKTSRFLLRELTTSKRATKVSRLATFFEQTFSSASKSYQVTSAALTSHNSGARLVAATCHDVFKPQRFASSRPAVLSKRLFGVDSAGEGRKVRSDFAASRPPRGKAEVANADEVQHIVYKSEVTSEAVASEVDVVHSSQTRHVTVACTPSPGVSLGRQSHASGDECNTNMAPDDVDVVDATFDDSVFERNKSPDAPPKTKRKQLNTFTLTSNSWSLSSLSAELLPSGGDVDKHKCAMTSSNRTAPIRVSRRHSALASPLHLLAECGERGGSSEFEMSTPVLALDGLYTSTPLSLREDGDEDENKDASRKDASTQTLASDVSSTSLVSQATSTCSTPLREHVDRYDVTGGRRSASTSSASVKNFIATPRPRVKSARTRTSSSPEVGLLDLSCIDWDRDAFSGMMAALGEKFSSRIREETKTRVTCSSTTATDQHDTHTGVTSVQQNVEIHVTPAAAAVTQQLPTTVNIFQLATPRSAKRREGFRSNFIKCSPFASKRDRSFSEAEIDFQLHESSSKPDRKLVEQAAQAMEIGVRSAQSVTDLRNVKRSPLRKALRRVGSAMRLRKTESPRHAAQPYVGQSVQERRKLFEKL